MRFAGIRRLAFLLSVGVAAGPLFAQSDPGAYLAARTAGVADDFAAAAQWFAAALEGDPTNTSLMDKNLTALVALGLFDQAGVQADQLVAAGARSQLAHMVRVAVNAQNGDWAAIFADLEAGQNVGPLVDGLTRAWGRVGQGQMTEALAAFDEVIAAPGLRAFGLYHKALALAVAGDFEAADAIMSLPPQDGFQRTRRSVLAQIEVLSQLDRNADAIALLDRAFGAEPEQAIADLRVQLEASEPLPFTFIADAEEGLAEVYFSVAGSLLEEADPTIVLIYARMALALNPGHVDSMLITADMLQKMKQYDLANVAYAMVPADDPAFDSAEIGRAEVLRQAGQMDRATEVLMQLARSHPDQPQVQAKLGDFLRRTDRNEEAKAAYTRAIELLGPESQGAWLVYYARGVTEHQMDQWPEAEADLRKALELNPNQPQVLNYLGYSLVERGEKLDEALAMIESAVAGDPQNGAIVDSLGWVYFQLGRYDEAVAQLERAAGLEPVDPVVNDHLGDAYWMVGRTLEAQFQWNRAMSFDPEDEEAARIRRKLDIGLDAVLAEEGAAPVAVANDGG
ncbi:MAG: tetratricopeptide repeat protein [Rhodobacterales bacterium]|nr:tetratricopeptide repeat protein [Rhodobacterales bacterium]